MGFLKFARTTLVVLASSLLVASVPGITAKPIYAQTAQQPIPSTVTQGGMYTNTWAIRVADGADVYSLAASAGLEVIMPIGSLRGYYLVRAANITSRAENITLSLRSLPGILYVEQQVTLERTTRVPQDDPLYPNQWHLDNTGQNSSTVGADANVTAAWDAGYTGEGVVVASVDDGVWVAHPDLAPNIRADLSYDFLNDDPDPSGGGHGSAVAGVMAGADNGLPVMTDYCGVGAAYNAEIAGLRMLGGGITDAIEASSLSFKPDDIHVYNNSWGPFDNGSTLEGPGTLTAAALQNGAFHGRNGLGTIYTWAAGNGGTNDNINADGYANSIYVIAVGSSTNLAENSGYSEPGSAMLINAPSDGGTLGIATTGYSSSGCTNSFGGTSSAAPLTAGVIALILEANPILTYRDVMHILVDTADVIDDTDTGWQTNGAGKQFSHYYGFGRINAGEAVTAAATWTPVTAQTFYLSAVETVSAAIPENAAAPVTDVINVPDNITAEHVQVVFNADHPSRGQIHVDLTSPDGTVSNMIFGRPDTGDNYQNWTMMTVANWGEVVTGDWTISVYDRSDDAQDGTFNSWQLIVWGTAGTQQLATPTELPSQTPYWTATATSTTAATPTAPTIAVTPTATEAPGTQLLANVSFELKDGDNKPALGAWTVINPTGEKIKCNKDSNNDGEIDKFFSHTGDCAFRFRGQVGENSKLRQEPDLSGLTFAAGDMLNLSAFIQTDGTPTATLKLIVKYSDGTEKTKQKLDITASETYAQVPLSALLASDAVESIRVSVDSKTTSGKLYVDDVTLTLLQMSGAATATPDSTATPELLPLP